MAIVDKKTPRLGLLLPNADNFLQDDVERLIQSFDLLDVLVVMRDQTTGKIADDQLSAVIARLDAQGKIATSALPSSVVQKGADGKIDASVLPSIAIIDSFPVPNEASMLGLQCERGDIAIRTDLGRSFILTDLPPSKLSNWRELTSTNVTSVNGQVGAITGLAKAGVNDDITQLTALSGPLRLGGEAAGDYDAVTLKQLRAASGGAGGASMNGVMNNFIGAVEWFNGSRAKLPAGYVAADGQLLSRTDPATIDLWNAVKNDLLISVLDTRWLEGTAGRANYSFGQKIANNDHSAANNGDATTGVNFRVPDLNGMQSGSVPALFLRGSGDALAQREIGPPGSVRLSASPNATGGFSLHAVERPNIISSVVGSLTAGTEHVGAYRSPWNIPESSGATSYGSVNFDLSKGSTSGVYGRDETGSGIPATEVRPNSAVGIWIIRASGTFTAQNTNFNVINGDTAAPAVGTVVGGGTLSSLYQIAGATAYRADFYSDNKYGQYNKATIASEDVLNGTNRGTLSVDTNGQVTTSARVVTQGVTVGKLLPQMAGQMPNPDHPDLDSCIFYAGDNTTAPSIGKPFNYWMGLNLAEGYHVGQAGNYFQQAFPVAVDAPPKFRIRIKTPSPRFTNWYSYLAQDTTTKTTQIDAYQGGWSEPKNGRAPLWLKTVSNNSGGFVPALSFGSASADNGTNYPMRTTLGLISRGTTQWPDAVLRMDGDAKWYGNYYFAMGGRIYGDNAIDQNNTSQAAWEFQRNALSDEQFKSDIKPYDGVRSLDNINALQMKTFRYTIEAMKPGTVRRGVIAQQAQQVDPEYVHVVKTPNSVETLTLDSNVLLLDALAAIQVLTRRIAVLEAKKQDPSES